MKYFLRTGAWYQSDTKALTDDLEISDLLNTPTSVTPKETVVSCNCKKEISDLNKRIDDLALLISKPEKLSIQSLSDFNAEHNKPASVTSRKANTKKDTAKKK